MPNFFKTRLPYPVFRSLYQTHRHFNPAVVPSGAAVLMSSIEVLISGAGDGALSLVQRPSFRYTARVLFMAEGTMFKMGGLPYAAAEL